MIARRGSLLLSGLLLLAGCPSAPPVEEPIVLLDDDDSADEPDDDDDSAVDPPLLLQAWIADIETLGTGPDALGQSHAVSAALTQPAPLGPWQLSNGTPVPGLGLHPDRADLFEGCEEIDSIAVDGLPAGADVGPALVLAPSSGDSHALPLSDGRYRIDAGPRLSAASQWTLSDAEADLVVPFSAPTRPTGILPGPGTISLLSPRNITWAPADGPVEIVLLRYASLVNVNAWQAVRCVAEDDGAFVIDPTSLAGPNTGDLELTVSRAEWSADGANVFVRSTTALASP